MVTLESSSESPTLPCYRRGQCRHVLHRCLSLEEHLASRCFHWAGDGGVRYSFASGRSKIFFAESQALIKSIESTVTGESTSTKSAKGLLSAANPHDRNIPPMVVLVSADLPRVSPPDDRVHIVTVRVVDQVPSGVIVGVGFWCKHEIVINFADDGGFKPIPA